MSKQVNGSVHVQWTGEQLKELGVFLKKARVKAGLTQREVGELLELKTSQYISNWERGIVGIAFPQLVKVCGLYKFSESKRKILIEKIVQTHHEQLTDNLLP